MKQAKIFLRTSGRGPWKQSFAFYKQLNGQTRTLVGECPKIRTASRLEFTVSIRIRKCDSADRELLKNRKQCEYNVRRKGYGGVKPK